MNKAAIVLNSVLSICYHCE